jgi:hypothetical protein
MFTVTLLPGGSLLLKREIYLSDDQHWFCTIFSISSFSEITLTRQAIIHSHFDRFCYEDREQLFLQAKHAKGECVTAANSKGKNYNDSSSVEMVRSYLIRI